MSGRLLVSLEALQANYESMRRAAGTDVAAVVKADAYGFGAAAVAAHLSRVGCREYFVATAGEGAALRQGLPRATIYVLEGALASTLTTLAEHALTPVLNTALQLESWRRVGKPAAVHVDTGMERLGIEDSTAAALLASPGFDVALLVSHFARADEPQHPFNQRQLERMRCLQGLGGAQRVSLSNSAAMLTGLATPLDQLGRAGIGLYGGNPYAGLVNPMRTVARLEGTVLQLRDVQPGTPVGYGGAYSPQRSSRLATVGLGYADGIPRLLSNCGRVYVGGERRPIVGRISMDLCHVDVSGLDVGEGDVVEVFGAHLTADEVAAQASTLAYEIFTGVGKRVPREYTTAPID